MHCGINKNKWYHLIVTKLIHPTTITRFKILLDTSQDPFNLSHWSFKTVRMISNKKYLTNQNNIKVHCHQMYVLLTIRTNLDFWTFDNLSFALFLAAFAVEDMAFSNSLWSLSVSFLFCPSFLQACIAWSCLVLAVSSIMVATLTVCLLTAVAEMASRTVVLMLHHSLIHQPL